MDSIILVGFIPWDGSPNHLPLFTFVSLALNYWREGDFAFVRANPLPMDNLVGVDFLAHMADYYYYYHHRQDRCGL